MAKNLQHLKKRIKAAKNIAQISKAMEMIAASKIKRAQKSVFSNKPYSQKIVSIANDLVRLSPKQKTKEKIHPYLVQNNASDKLLIVISPDRGLCGSLITNLTKKILETSNANTLIVSIGKKIEKFLAKTNARLVASFPMGSLFPKYSVIYPIIEIINEYFLKKRVAKVEVLYSAFSSIFVQTPTVEQLLPFTIKQEESDQLIINNTSYIFEPSANLIISTLFPHLLEVLLYKAITQSYTSEQAARMTAMKNAKDNAVDIAQFLTLEYNKSRQEKITNEILDLSNGASTFAQI